MPPPPEWTILQYARAMGISYREAKQEHPRDFFDVLRMLNAETKVEKLRKQAGYK